MEKKIVELSKIDTGYQCIICCEKESTTRIRIKRLVYDDNIASFYVCDECLAKMQKDIENRK